MATLASPAALFARARASSRARAGRMHKARGGCAHCLNEDEKMFVPPGAFGGTTPERRAAQLMNAMITYVSAWIVIAQLENVAPRSSLKGEDGGFDGERETTRIVDSHEFLLDYLEANPVKDGDEWLTSLTSVNPTLGERIMAVRRAYAELDFEWHNVKRVCVEDIAEGNERAMRAWIKSAIPQSAA